MANPVRQTVAAVGNGPPVLLDFLQSPFNVSVGVDVSNAVGAVYGVQYTLADFTNLVIPGGAVAPLWRNDTLLPPGQTTSGVSNYQNPVIGVRLVVSALTSGTVVLEVVQGMNAQ